MPLNYAIFVSILLKRQIFHRSLSTFWTFSQKKVFNCAIFAYSLHLMAFPYPLKCATQKCDGVRIHKCHLRVRVYAVLPEVLLPPRNWSAAGLIRPNLQTG